MANVLNVWDSVNEQWINVPALSGDPGIYIGTSTPTDPNKKVWIDPSGTADVKYKIYNSVEDLGLTVGSATIAGAVAALPANSILIAQSEDWLASELPGSYGLVEICKQGTSTRVSIEFRGRREIDGTYIMYMTSGVGSVPTGTWVRLPSQRTSLQLTWESNINSQNNFSHAETDGHLVVINLKATLPTLTLWTELKIATIPQGYRPSGETQTIVADNKGVCICLLAKENGDLKINPSNVTDLTSRYFRGCLTYFID